MMCHEALRKCHVLSWSPLSVRLRSVPPAAAPNAANIADGGVGAAAGSSGKRDPVSRVSRAGAGGCRRRRGFAHLIARARPSAHFARHALSLSKRASGPRGPLQGRVMFCHGALRKCHVLSWSLLSVRLRSVLPVAARNAANIADGGVGAAAAPNAANIADGGVGAATGSSGKQDPVSRVSRARPRARQRAFAPARFARLIARASRRAHVSRRFLRAFFAPALARSRRRNDPRIPLPPALF